MVVAYWHGEFLGLLLANKTPQRLHLVNLWFRLETATLINMQFKKKEKQLQEDEKVKSVFKDENGNAYPSGFKLWLLMASVFVSMFLVSLVSLRQHNMLRYLFAN